MSMTESARRAAVLEAAVNALRSFDLQSRCELLAMMIVELECEQPGVIHGVSSLLRAAVALCVVEEVPERERKL